MYGLECICGETVNTQATEGRCPRCQRLFRIEWQAKYSGPHPTPPPSLAAAKP